MQRRSIAQGKPRYQGRLRSISQPPPPDPVSTIAGALQTAPVPRRSIVAATGPQVAEDPVAAGGLNATGRSSVMGVRRRSLQGEPAATTQQVGAHDDDRR